jgi:hypothetical protein
MSIKKILLPGLGLGAWVVAALIPVIANSIANGAQDLWQVQPYRDRGSKENAEREFQKKQPKPTDSDFEKKVLARYGIPTSEKDRFVVSASSIQRPLKDRPDLAFIFVDKSKGENPWQAKTVLFLGKVVSAGGVITGAFFLILWLLSLWAAPAKGARLASAE